MNEDQVAGGLKDTVGKVKDAAGGLTGDTSLQMEGKVDQASGTVQSKLGATADRIGDVAGDVGRATRDAAASATQGAGAMAGRVYDMGASAGQRVAETVKPQTLFSVIGAAVLGYGIAYLLHSPSSPLAPRPRATRYLPRF